MGVQIGGVHVLYRPQNIELQDEAEGIEDLHPDFSENYDLSDDLGIPSAALNN